MADTLDMARELGRSMARSDEYQALKRSIAMADDDREIVELTQKLEALETRLHGLLEQGRKPDQEIQNEYENTVTKLQASSTYQRLVAAQSNFDRVVQRVNQAIAQGLEEGAQSRIILPS